MRVARPILSYENGSAREITQKHPGNMEKQYRLRQTKLEPEALVAASLYTVDKMKHLSSDLLQGKYDIKPKKITGQDPPCKYCDFLSVCGFEPKNDAFDELAPIEKMQDEKGKNLTKAAAFHRKCSEERTR